MNYDNIFWFFSKESGEGAIYDGSKRTPMPSLKNGVRCFQTKTVWQGKCTESELMKKVNEYENNNKRK